MNSRPQAQCHLDRSLFIRKPVILSMLFSSGPTICQQFPNDTLRQLTCPGRELSQNRGLEGSQGLRHLVRVSLLLSAIVGA
jgi:hypothetical protein